MLSCLDIKTTIFIFRFEIFFFFQNEKCFWTVFFIESNEFRVYDDHFLKETYTDFLRKKMLKIKK